MYKRLSCSLLLVVLLIPPFGGSWAAAHVQAAPALVKTASAQILVNAQGMTLYIFSPDKHNKSACLGECAKFWPPVTVPKAMDVRATMPGISGTFGVAMRAGGVRQLTYDGAPLYTFIKDKKPGDMAGQGVAGVWWIVVAPAAKASSKSG